MGSWESTIESWLTGDASPSGDRLYTAEELGGHLDRNEWQADLVPTERPPSGVWQDPETGVEWHEDGPIERHFAAPYHSIDTDGDGHNDLALDCFRGTLPDEVVQSLRNDPDYREAFSEVAGPDSSWNVDDVTPGAQVCYDPRDSSLTNSGTWDYASPSWDQIEAHHDLDVDTHTHFNTYEDPNTASVSSEQWTPPTPELEPTTDAFTPTVGSFEAPVFEAPVFEAPVFEAPAYDPGPSYVEPTYDPPVSDTGAGGYDGGGSSSGPSD